MNDMVVHEAQRARKTEWQRKQRREFAAAHGYSTAAHYGTAGQRERILQRDGSACVQCGLTDEQHKAKWNRPITIDHKDKDRSNNTDDNLQTLCLTCHGRKDQLPRLRAPRIESSMDVILAMRASGATYQQIADEHGFSIATVWKWCKRWSDK